MGNTCDIRVMRSVRPDAQLKLAYRLNGQAAHAICFLETILRARLILGVIEIYGEAGAFLVRTEIKCREGVVKLRLPQENAEESIMGQELANGRGPFGHYGVSSQSNLLFNVEG